MSAFDGSSIYHPQYYSSLADSNRLPDESQPPSQQGDPVMASSLMAYPHDLGQFQNVYSNPSHQPGIFESSGPSPAHAHAHASGLQMQMQTHHHQHHHHQPPAGYSMRGPNLEGRMPNVDISYDPWSAAGTPMPMGLDAGDSFAYDVSNTYPVPHPLTSQMGLTQHAPYSTFPPAQGPVQDPYWDMDQIHSTPRQDQPVAPGQGGGQRQGQGQLQDSQMYNYTYAPAVSNRSLQPRAIQPKRQSPLKDSFPSHVKSESRTENSPYTNIYSTSGFDILGVLARVISRPDPKINVGAVDLSCAFVLCDITQNDHPIVYVSEAFGRLTGYSSEEIVGRNCRFLQSPDNTLQSGTERKFVDSDTVYRLRTTIEERDEIQASLINYRKGGQPFMNLITMIPVRWDSEDYRFYVGFQVDLVEKPDAITQRNPNGTYMINYQRHQLPNYVVPPPDVYQSHLDLSVQFGHHQVSAILRSLASRPEYRSYLDRILVENTDDVIQVLSYDGAFLYLSPSCRRVLEYNPAELMGKTLSTICHPSDIGPVTRDLRASITAAPVGVAYRIRKKHSGYTWFESHGSWHVERGRGRTFLVLLGRERPVYCLDQIAELGSESLAENDIWAKLSISGMILYISTKSRPTLGRAPEDLVGTSLQDLIGTEDRSEAQQALQTCRSGQQATFYHQIRHKKGHLIPAQTVLFPGDTKERTKPSFLVAQVRSPKSATGNTPGNEEPTPTDTAMSLTGGGVLDVPGVMDPSQSPSDSQVFRELAPTRGSSWQFELRELEKRNRTLSEELQRLLARKKKRKRKQTAIPVGKNCAMCQARNTPEWRRGPSGNRDLCNSCGLRWAKQVRSTTQSEKSASS